MIRNMKEMGMSNREIAKDLGVSMNTVGRMLKKTRIQVRKRKKRGSKLDPDREKIRALIDEHNLSSIRILEEIRKSWYNGGYTWVPRCHEKKESVCHNNGICQKEKDH